MAYKIKHSPFKQIGMAASLFGTNQGPISTASSMIGNTPMQPQLPISTASSLVSNAPVANQVPISAASSMIGSLASQNATSQIKPAVPASVIAPAASTIKPLRGSTINPRSMVETPINPRGFSNSKAIRGAAGRPNRGTFTRTVQSNEGPMMQLANPGMLEDGPQLPPEAVQTSVTPTLGFENS